MEKRKKDPFAGAKKHNVTFVDDDGEEQTKQIMALDQGKHPNIVLLGICKMEEVDIEIKLGGTVYWAFPVHQDVSALYIVITDMSIVLIYILFIYILDAK